MRSLSNGIFYHKPSKSSNSSLIHYKFMIKENKLNILFKKVINSILIYLILSILRPKGKFI